MLEVFAGVYFCALKLLLRVKKKARAGAGFDCW